MGKSRRDRSKGASKKPRRRRHKASNVKEQSVSGKTLKAMRKLTQAQPKTRVRKRSAVHPSPMELGLTPSKVDGPGKGGEQKLMLTIYLFPLVLAVIASIMFPPNSTRMGAKPPFVNAEDLVGLTHSEVTYNPKSTGIEYIKTTDVAWVRRNTTYARQEVGIELGELEYRNYQLIYVYALVGRDVPDGLVEKGHTNNATYAYTQHLRASIVGFTDDGLGEVELVTDYEVERRVRCDRFQEWCRKIPMGVVSELNFPRFEARVRFSRPNQRLGAPLSFNSTIPIKGKVVFEVLPPSWIVVEFLLRYVFNIIAVVAFLWPVTGMGPSLWSRPIEDWTAPRMWCIAVFLSLFFFNEPFYVVRVWVPDAQDGLRSFNSWMTTACVAFEIGFIMFVFFSAKVEMPQPPSLVMWIGADQRKAAEISRIEQQRLKEKEAKVKAGLISPILSMHRPDTPPGGTVWTNRPSSALLRNPLFYVTTKNAFRNSEERRQRRDSKREKSLKSYWKNLTAAKARSQSSGGGKGGNAIEEEKGKEEEDEEDPAPWRVKALGKGPHGSITLKSDGPKAFFFEALRQLTLWVNSGAGPLTKPWSWSLSIGPCCIGAAVFSLWILGGSLYTSQLSNGLVPRARLTSWYALDQHPNIMVPLALTCGLSYLFIWATMMHASEEIFYSTPVYMCFFAVSHLTGILLIFGTLNCSWYAIGTPLFETCFFRALVNSYAWVVLFMAQPLADDGTGHFAKRRGMGTAPVTIEEDEEESESESEDENEAGDDPTTTTKKSYKPVVPTVPKLGMQVEDVSSGEEKEEDDDDDGDDEEESKDADNDSEDDDRESESEESEDDTNES